MKMEKQDANVSFTYVYSADEQDEIRRIRQKYQIQEEDNMSRLRKMDEAVTQKATVISLVAGIAGMLVMGFGMSLIMTDLGTTIGIHGSIVWSLGIAVGLIGIILVASAYPTYSRVLKKERKKAAPEILKLTEELMR